MDGETTDLATTDFSGARAFIVDTGIVTSNEVTGLVGSGRSDDWIISEWLHGRPHETVRAYTRDANRFFAFVDKDLRTVTLTDMQGFQDSLAGMAPRSVARMTKSIRSLMTFASKLGYCHFNVGAALRPIRVPQDLAERILPKNKIHLILGKTEEEGNLRDIAVLNFLYYTGCRVSEVSKLCWKDLREVDDTAIAALQGKGEKTIFSRLRPDVYEKLLLIKPEACDRQLPVFVGEGRTNKMNPKSIWVIVRKYSKMAGIDLPMSPHWYRHAHASHALQAGAPVSLVQHQLGHSSIATTGVYAHVAPEDSSSRYL